jgi:hypothetical protein
MFLLEEQGKTRVKPSQKAEMRCEIIVAAVASPDSGDVLFGAGCILVCSEAGIDIAGHLPDTCQAPVEEVVDTPVGRTGEAADIRTGTAVVADLLEAQP